MLLQVIFLICCSSAIAEKNFWNNEICFTDDDCSGLKSCDTTFGCTVSVEKVGLIMFGVFLALCVIAFSAACLCRRNCGNSQTFVRPHNQYVPQTVITTNPPQWNQNQIGTTTVYPHNPYANQFYANSVNPSIYNQTDPRMVPTAPYPPAGYNYGQTHQSAYTTYN